MIRHFDVGPCGVGTVWLDCRHSQHDHAVVAGNQTPVGRFEPLVISQAVGYACFAAACHRGIIGGRRAILGRKLDFIAQEMNREANTILSKANDIEVSDKAIALKTEIEKVREQIQNIE